MQQLLEVPVAQCQHNRFNTRKTRDQEQIERLAQRIQDIGFERTRAPWAIHIDGHYEVFAGGTRLEAARYAGLDVIPILVHTDLTDEEISKRADIDNENDEYHAPVSPVDVWAEYARLRDEEGWTQEVIARAKGISQGTVAQRLKYHSMSDAIKDFIAQGLLSEGHLKGICSVSLAQYFSPWLTTVQAWEELAEIAVRGLRKNGKKTTRATAKDVGSWKRFITEAEKIYNSLKTIILYDLPEDGEPTLFEFDAQTAFVQELAEREAQSLTKVKEAARAIRLDIKENLAAYEEYIKAKSAQAARAAIKAERERALLTRFALGDCVELLSSWQLKPIRLLLTDPPYGKDYQSNRRWRSVAPDKIQGDDRGALGLLSDAIQHTIPHLAENAHVLVFCDWQREPEVRQTLVDAGLAIKGSLIWMKEEHSAGDVKGAFGPSHERIVHAVKGSPDVTPRIRDVLQVTRSHETSHPTEKPIALLEKLILSTTSEGDLVVDPFAGCASTLFAAMNQRREFWGAEVDPNYHDEGCERLLEELNNAEARI